MNPKFTSMNHFSVGLKYEMSFYLVMEKRALVLALALTLPLALYGIPYAYAATVSSSYVVSSGQNEAFVHCKTGDYATGGGFSTDTPGAIVLSRAAFFDGTSYSFITNGQPNAWGAVVGLGSEHEVQVVCQTPVTVAGIGVPEFGSLYVAIALGAVVYFMLARHFTKRPAISVQA
jgi:hypothetical protein